MFLHRLTDEHAHFHVIDAEGDVRLKVTEHHLIYTKSCDRGDPLRLVHAKDIAIGECIYTSAFADGISVFRPALVKNISIVRLFKSILLPPIIALSWVQQNRLPIVLVNLPRYIS